MVLYKKVTSVIRCCQTNSDTIGTCGTSGTSGTSFRVLREHRVLQVHGHCNLIGNAKQHHNAYQALVFVIRLPNNIPRRHCNFFDKIKNPSGDKSERSSILCDVFPSVCLLIRIEVCTLREPLYSINGLAFSDMSVVLLVSNLVTYPYPSCSGTTES